MYGVRNRPMPRAVSMELPVGSNRAMSFQRPRLVFYWCCSVLFEWCFLALRTRQRQMGVQGTYLRPQTKFEKITDRRFRPEFPAVSTNNHRPRFPALGYFPENGAYGAREYFREIRVLFLHSFMDQPRLAGVVYQLPRIGLWCPRLSTGLV